MAIGESQMYCVDCRTAVLSKRAGLLNEPHCPWCGRKFTMKDNFRNASRLQEWRQSRK